MRRFPFILIALLGLVFQCLGAVVSSWSCEGKTCSTDALACCCGSVAPGRDSVCKPERRVGKACAGKCACKLTVKSVRSISAVHAVSKIDFVLDLPVVLPQGFVVPAGLIFEYAPILANPPPVAGRPPLVAGAPLRAPPVSFV